MKYLVIFFLVFSASNVFSAEKKKAKKAMAPETEDKTYQVEKHAPQINIGEATDPNQPILHDAKRSPDYWRFAILLIDLNFDLPALTGGEPEFSQNFVGVKVSRVHDNKLLGTRGNLEYGGQWQQYERSTKIGPRGDFSQKINLFQLNVFQNFNLVRAFQDSLFITAGVGGAPVYLTSEQSIYNNSMSELGYQLMAKANFIFPVKTIFSWSPTHLAANVEVLASTGRVAEHTMSTLTLGVGVDFE